MTIDAAELKIYEPETINDTGTNGGYMSANEITSGSTNNLYPNIPEAERVAGSTSYRKFFFKIADSENGTLFNSTAHMSLQTPADDYVTFFAATQIDTQTDILGSEDEYGCGNLNATVVATDTSVVVFVENSALVLFRVGDYIKLFDGSNSEIALISNVSPSGNLITLTIGALTNGYSSTNTLVASLLDASNVECSYSGFTVTSSNSGTYDDTTYPVALKNIGSVQDDFTITFDSATTFTISGAKVGSVGSGNVTSNAQPLNTDFSEYYFVMDWLGFGGTFAINDTIEFTTVPANIPIWTKRIVPAGAAAYSGNSFKMIVDGESS